MRNVTLLLKKCVELYAFFCSEQNITVSTCCYGKYVFPMKLLLSTVCGVDLLLFVCNALNFSKMVRPRVASNAKRNVTAGCWKAPGKYSHFLR